MQARNWLMLITFIGLALRMGWAITHLETADMGDYILYSEGARHIVEEGDFSNSLFLVRPPLFPLWIALLGNHTPTILMINALIGTLMIPLVYTVARLFGMSERVAVGASALYALDYTAIVYAAALLDPVPLASLFLMLMLICLLIATRPPTRHPLVWGMVAGGCLVLSVLARPESYLIWTGLSVFMVLAYRARWRAVVVYVAVSVLGLGGWVLHNQQVFGNPTVSTVGAFTMLFYRASSVERLATGLPMDTVYLNLTQRVEAKLGHDPALATLDTRWGYHAALPEVEDALYAVSFEIFREHPLAYLATFGVGFVRMFGMDPPIVRAEANLLGAWFIVVWNGLVWLGAVVGLVQLARNRQVRVFVWVFLIGGYYTVGTLISKNAALVGRERAVLLPLMFILMAYAVVNWRTRQDPLVDTEVG